MKKIKNTILAALLFVGMTAFTLYESLEIGAKAPMATLKMKDTNGKMLSLTDVKKENGLLVMFTCNTCPFVKAWEDRYSKIQKTAAEKGIGVILVNSNEGKRDKDDSMEAMKKHAAEKGFTAPYVVDVDSKLANAFGASTTPHVYLFNKEFKLAYVGAIDDNYKSASDADKHFLMDAINNMTSGKSINPTETKALGCSIKRP